MLVGMCVWRPAGRFVFRRLVGVLFGMVALVVGVLVESIIGEHVGRGFKRLARTLSEGVVQGVLSEG